jgi:hypothetical protein
MSQSASLSEERTYSSAAANSGCAGASTPSSLTPPVRRNDAQKIVLTNNNRPLDSSRRRIHRGVKRAAAPSRVHLFCLNTGHG